MFGFLSRFWRTSVVGTFLAGSFFLLPVVLTIFIIIWLVRWIKDALGPGTFFGELILQSGKVLVGRDYEYIAFALGLLIAVIGIWILGLFVRTQARKGLESAFDATMDRVPFFRTIYKPVARIVRFASGDPNAEELAGMSVVRCRLGGLDGVDTLALLASSQTYTLDGERRKLVYFPTSPIPMSGYLLFMPEKNITPVTGMQVDQLMKIYVSLGALAPENMPAEFIAAPQSIKDLATNVSEKTPDELE
ncbi:MAG: DUF502 domain-containing protein [Hyphomicrobiaceae bacterium]|nr:DUF502 domain-containing protein [Hyphomicrobiaceae bacterium]